MAGSVRLSLGQDRRCSSSCWSSSGGSRPPQLEPTAGSLGDLHSDVEAVTTVFKRIDDGVVLVGHSRGAMVQTELGDHPLDPG
jgi:pimeloyl-ACP methyl ester carboxylesterase